MWEYVGIFFLMGTIVFFTTLAGSSPKKKHRDRYPKDAVLN